MSGTTKHLGRDLADETQAALTCDATTDPDPWTGKLCGLPAVAHIRWATGEPDGGFSCADHLPAALRFNPHSVHQVTGLPCGLPGVLWFDGPPSRCELSTTPAPTA